MLNRYYEADNCKKDIERFCNMVCGDKRIQKSKITCVAKNVLFLKKFFYFYVDNNQTHYYSCLINDMLVLVHSLSQNSIRIYYVTFRSLIENLIRVLLKYDDMNATGVRNMFTEFAENSCKEYYSYLEGEYGKCCNVVHSNANFTLPMYSFYEELLLADEVNDKIIDAFCDSMMTFYKKLKDFLIDNKPDDIWAAFRNNNEVLYTRVGQRDYERLEGKIEK